MAASRKARSPRGASNTSAGGRGDNLVLHELDTVKRLLMLQLVGSGMKPVDIALTLGVAKSVISAIIPVRRLSIRKRQGREMLLDIEAKELTKRLDTLIALERNRKTSG
ncbi:MAG: hypothetical protein ACRD2L_17835 [Terriglobia bacterium]